MLVTLTIVSRFIQLFNLFTRNFELVCMTNLRFSRYKWFYPRLYSSFGNDHLKISIITTMTMAKNQSNEIKNTLTDNNTETFIIGEKRTLILMSGWKKEMNIFNLALVIF